MMRLAAIILMLSAFACLIPIPALCDTTTYTCQYQSYSDKKGNHKMAEDFKLSSHRRYREGDRQNRRQQGKFQCRDAVFPERGHDVHRNDRRGQDLTTTIDPSGESVHSRNIIVEGEIRPSQSTEVPAPKR